MTPKCEKCEFCKKILISNDLLDLHKKCEMYYNENVGDEDDKSNVRNSVRTK